MKLSDQIVKAINRKQYTSSLSSDNVLSDLLNEVDALEAKLAPKWLSIESAPKDGTEILVFTKTQELVVTHWTTDGFWAHGSDPVIFQMITPPPTGEIEVKS